MRVIHVGNLANFPYRLVKALRRKGFDAHIIIPIIHESTQDPTFEDPDLSKSFLPPWIHFWNNTHPLSKIQLIRALRKYDLIHAYTGFPIAAMFSFKPYIAHSTGSDLRELAIKDTYEGFLLRLAYRRARMLLFGNPDQITVITRLRLKNTYFLPNLIDTSKYSPSNENLRNEYPHEVLIFHPTTLEWRLKGNDLLLRAYAKLIKEIKKSVLLFLSSRGLDLDKTKKLVNKLGIGNYIKFIPLLNQQELLRYYRISDIVVDQFIIGSIGNIALEAMSCGKPVLAHISEEHFKLCYPEPPPILRANTEEQIYEKLYELVTNKDERMKIGEKSRIWVLKYHDSEKITKKLIKIYEIIGKEE